MGIVFVGIFIYMIIATPDKYVFQGKIRMVAEVQAQTISDQSDLANISTAAANTVIGLIKNSDTVGTALTSAHLENEIDAAKFANERVSAVRVNDSDIIEITVIFDSDYKQATSFTYYLLTTVCNEISATNFYGTTFKGEIVEDGRQIAKQPAIVPSLLYALYGALAVLVAYLLIQLIAVITDKTLRTSDKFEKITRIPVIASVPAFSRLGGERSAQKLSNAYRILRSAIKYSQDKVRSVVICSPSARDGRTSVAVGLATALAETDAMVLLIEADMRRPDISKEMHIESAYGLADLLLGNKSTLASTICKTSNRNLYVITGINNTNLSNVNISDLLDSAVFDELLEAVQGQFDYVIIDTPSIEVAPDATSLIGKVDCAVAVAQYGHTKVDSIRSALDIFTASGGNLIGLVTTNTPQHSGLFSNTGEGLIRGSHASRRKNPLQSVNDVFNGGTPEK